MSFRPPTSPGTKPSRVKTGFGHLPDNDPKLLTLAEAGGQLGLRPAARRFGISHTMVRRAMKIHGVKLPQ